MIGIGPAVSAFLLTLKYFSMPRVGFARPRRAAIIVERSVLEELPEQIFNPLSYAEFFLGFIALIFVELLPQFADCDVLRGLRDGL